MDNSIDYDPNPTPEATPSPDYDPVVKSIPDSAIPDRAVKYHVAMGVHSPGIDNLAASLSNGEDDKMRQQMLQQKDIDFQQAKVGMIGDLIKNSPNGVNPDDVDFVRGMNAVDFGQMHNASNIMETEYAKKFVQTIAARDSQRNFERLESVSPEGANQRLDIAEWAVARNSIAQTLLEETQEAKQQQGWGSYLGDIVGSNIPLAAVRLNNLASQAPSTALLPGTNLQQQIDYLHTLSPDDFSKQVREAAESMPNLALREQFLSAVIQQSDSDAHLSNLMAVGDIAGIADTGISIGEHLAKGLGKGAAKAISQSALQSSVKDTTVSDFLDTTKRVYAWNSKGDVSTVAGGRTDELNKYPSKSLGIMKVWYKPGEEDTADKVLGLFNKKETDLNAEADRHKQLGQLLDYGDHNAQSFADDFKKRAVFKDGRWVIPLDQSQELKDALASTLKSSVSASKDSHIDPAKIAGETGDFKSAAVIHSIRAANQGVEGEGEAGLRLNARSINDPSTWFTGGTVDLSKNNSQDFLKVSKSNPELAEEFLNGPSVERVSEADRVAIRQRIYDSVIHGNEKSIQGAVLDVDSKGIPIEPTEGPLKVSVEDKSSVLLIQGEKHPADNTNNPRGWATAGGDEDDQMLGHDQSDGGFGSGGGGETYHEIIDSASKAKIGELNGHLSEDGSTFHVGGVHAIGPAASQPNSIGIERIRSLLSQIKEMYPTATAVDGIRVSGVRRAVGKISRGIRDLGRVALPELDVKTERTLIRGSGNKFAIQEAEHSLTNTETMTIIFGRKNGEGFPNKASAVKFVMDNLGQHQMDISRNPGSNIVTHGGKWYVRLLKDLPDDLDNFKNAEVPVNDKFQEGFWGGTLKGLIGKAKGQQNTLGQSNIAARKVVVHGNQRFFHVFRDMLQPIRNLSGDERKKLGIILENNRNYVDRETGERGMFFRNQGEFEQAYHSKYGIIPSPRSIAAYYSYVQANQLDGMIRNAGWARDKIRLGVKNYKDQYTKIFSEDSGSDFSQTWTPIEFEGKAISGDIPWKDGHDSWIAVRNSDTGELHIFRKQFASKAQKDLITKELNGNGRIIQAADGHLPIEGVDAERTVSFYVTGSAQEGRIKVNGPWKDGGHVINEQKFYVKQPNARGNYFTGDTAIATAPNAQVAAERAQAWDTARMNLGRWSYAQIEQHISETGIGNGMSGEEFANLFEGQRTADGVVRKGLSKDQPILWTQSGEQTIDRHKTALKQQENPYNLLDLDRKFAGERNSQNIPALIAEKGVKYRVEDGRLVDPLETLSEAAKSMVDVKLKRDYVLKSASQWAQQFQDILQPTALRGKNSIAQLYNPEYLPSADKIVRNNAENARKSILRFAGSLDDQERALETFKGKMAEIAYGVLGDKKFQVAENWLLPVLGDPARAARSFAFHLKMGLFSPMHMFLQASTLTNVMAISPRAALKGIPAYFPLRVAIINPSMLEHSAQVANKFGWNVDHFKEMYQSMIKSGWNEVHGDQALLDDIANPGITNTKGRAFLDAGSAMSDEGIKIHRIAAFATAYQEWRLANPVAELSRSAEHQMLSRADDLTANMSAANNSIWQKGLASIPTQFFTYQIRTMEQYLGKTLTSAEKLRLFGVHSAMYGIPTAVGGAIGVWPIVQSVKDSLTAHNIPYDDAITDTVLNGIPQLLTRLATGSDFDVGQRFGPEGIDIGYELMHGQKSLSDLLLGVSGSVVGDVLSTSVPFVKAMWSTLSDDPKDSIYPLDVETLENVTKNVTSLNTALKLWYAMNTGRWMSKYSIAQDEVTPFQAVFMGLTGANLSEINDMYRKSTIMKDRRTLADSTSIEVRDYLRRGMGEEDDKQRAEYMRIAKAHAVAGGLTPIEWQQCLTQALQSIVETRKESTAQKFLKDSQKRGYQ